MRHEIKCRFCRSVSSSSLTKLLMSILCTIWWVAAGQTICFVVPVILRNADKHKHILQSPRRRHTGTTYYSIHSIFYTDGRTNGRAIQQEESMTGACMQWHPSKMDYNLINMNLDFSTFIYERTLRNKHNKYFILRWRSPSTERMKKRWTETEWHKTQKGFVGNRII